MFYVGVMYISPRCGDAARTQRCIVTTASTNPSSRTNCGGHRLVGPLRRIRSLLLLLLLEAIELDGTVQQHLVVLCPRLLLSELVLLRG